MSGAWPCAKGKKASPVAIARTEAARNFHTTMDSSAIPLEFYCVVPMGSLYREAPAIIPETPIAMSREAAIVFVDNRPRFVESVRPGGWR